MAWRCRFLTARPSQDGRVIAEKRLSEELSRLESTRHSGLFPHRCALDIGDVAKAADKAQAAAAWERGRKAINSALIVLNKEISPKVGEQFVLVER